MFLRSYLDLDARITAPFWCLGKNGAAPELLQNASSLVHEKKKYKRLVAR